METQYDHDLAFRLEGITKNIRNCATEFNRIPDQRWLKLIDNLIWNELQTADLDYRKMTWEVIEHIKSVKNGFKTNKALTKYAYRKVYG